MRGYLLARRLSFCTALAGALLAAAGCHLDLSAGAEARDQWQRSYKLAKGGTLELRNSNGVLKFEVTDGDSIEVKAERVVKASSDQAAKDALVGYEIRETVTPDRITIDSTNSGGGIMINMSRRVEYQVRVPRWVHLKIDTTNGDVELSGAHLTGSFEAGTTNGSIHATGLESTARAHTTNGQINLEVSKLGEDGISCQTTNGTIDVKVPSDVNAQLSARVTNGAIETEGLTLAVSEKSRRRLDASIGRGGAPIKLETTNGAIGIRAGASNK